MHTERERREGANSSGISESGLGKSTLINSLFLTDLYSTEYPGPSHRIKKTVQVEQSKVLIKEGGVQLLLTIVDTPGFGDAVDNSNCWQPVIDHIDSKFEDYLNAESRVNRRQMPDNRVHCCLYFIAPSGHGSTSTKEDDFLSIINARDKKAFEGFPFYKAVWKSIESIWERSASATACFPRANKLYRMPTSQKDHLFKLPKLDTILATPTAATSSRPSTSDHADKKVDTFLKRGYTASTCGMCISNYQVYAVQYQHKLWGCDAIDTYARTVASVVAARRCIQMKTLAPTPDTQSRILELPFQGDLLFGTGVRLFVPDEDDLVLFNRDERLKPLDIEFMKRLHEKVNIIPLIAKADTLTPEECQQFKKQIMKEIQEHKIKMYEFPEMDDEEENKLVKKITDRLPLAVVGSNTVIEVSGKRVRGRQYPWGVAEVENSEHCDFTILRNMLIRTHMQDLKDVTNNVHYENYRSRKLAAVTYNGVDNNRNKGQLTKYDTVEGM
ncbi:Septin-7 [Acipenser ruthenus]|uniref:Septin-7 n=1 Tax=Acipenser ruthenus TaxID=7906 RepID=A0A444U1Q5_ACIRT|nr:Septin-7 [Acipenser ruthenus]